MFFVGGGDEELSKGPQVIELFLLFIGQPPASQAWEDTGEKVPLTLL